MTYAVESPLPPSFDIAAGNVPGWSVVHKFGRHLALGTSYVPVTIGGVFQTPQAASATTLRVKAGNANDTAAGTGAREVTLEGLDETGALVTEAVATAGASASSVTTATFMRLFRVYVSASGTYATAAAGSHSADIVIENGAGGTDWATIDSTGFSRAQSEIGVYSVPLGYTAYVSDVFIDVAGSNKPTDILFFQRRNILDSAAPYSAMRVVIDVGGLETASNVRFTTPLRFPALTDIGFMAKAASGTPEVDIEFDVVLHDGT